jgi:general secretion pathway protein G
MERGFQRGFTLIELLVVMGIVGILISIAIPVYQPAMTRAKESVLKNQLFTLRTQIDEYSYDKQRAPQSLDDLVTEGYLRAIPKDPATDSPRTWRLVKEDPAHAVNPAEPGIWDVRSGSDRKSLEGTAYSEW